jgi:hypothetical protein
MSAAGDCCETSDGVPRQAACPITATPGTPVQLQTVKAMLTDVSLQRLVPTTYYFCAEPSCDVVYFSRQGECYSKDDLRAPVWQKEPVGSRLLCYCFGESEKTIAAEIAATGTSHALDRVKEHVRSGRCACDIRNPRGICCLSDLKAAIARFGDAAKPDE